ncbi:hypothetical protein Barb4_04673 [Bacteroidales bacterium Barb4]|nr:hypothetical protein Barb4_04673 [Bacteroidales bacterium Barb4]
MHTGAGRVGDDNVRATVAVNEGFVQKVFHIASVEKGVCDAVQGGVYFGIFDGFGNVFDADHLTGLTGDEVGDGAGAGVKVIDKFAAGQSGELAGNFVEIVSLFAVRLVEGFGTNFEGKPLHLFDDMVFAAKKEHVLIGYRVVAFFVDNVLQGSYFVELLGEAGEESLPALAVFAEEDDDRHDVAH